MAMINEPCSLFQYSQVYIFMQLHNFELASQGMFVNFDYSMQIESYLPTKKLK